MIVFGTISTNSHLFKCFALANSLFPFGGILKILLINEPKSNQLDHIPSNCELIFVKELQLDLAKKLINKHKGDKLRWSLKPIFLLHLLKKFEKVVYVDNDIFFFNDYKELETELDGNNVLLTPHHYPSSPQKNQTWLEANFRIGLFNAGFVGVNRNAAEALQWWAECCLYEMKRSFSRGLFDDQKYLDLMPIKFEGVKILKDRGYNLAGWNDDVKLTGVEIKFIHFNDFTLLKFFFVKNRYHSHFKKYTAVLEQFNPRFKFEKRKFDFFKLQNALYYMKWKARRKF